MLVADVISSSPALQEVEGPSLFEEMLYQDHTQGLDGAALPDSINLEYVSEGSTQVLYKISFFFFSQRRL